MRKSGKISAWSFSVSRSLHYWQNWELSPGFKPLTSSRWSSAHSADVATIGSVPPVLAAHTWKLTPSSSQTPGSNSQLLGGIWDIQTRTVHPRPSWSAGDKSNLRELVFAGTTRDVSFQQLRCLLLETRSIFQHPRYYVVKFFQHLR